MVIGGASVTLDPAWEAGMNPEVFKIPIIKVGKDRLPKCFSYPHCKHKSCNILICIFH